MSPIPFFVGAKFDVLKDLLEGDPATIAVVAASLPFAALLIFFASKARRKLNAKRGRTLHGELEGSTHTEHSSGVLIFEVGYAHAGIQTVIRGHQTGRKLEHTSVSLPLPAGWTGEQLRASLQEEHPAMAYFSVEPLDGAVRFRCEGIGLPGAFFQGVMASTAGLLESGT